MAAAHPGAALSALPAAPGPRLRVLVTDAESRAALATVRALGARGHEVHVTSARPRALAAASRFAAAEHVVADAWHEPAAFARDLVRVAGETRADLVVPISEVTHGSAYAHSVERQVVLAGPGAAAYEAAVDKQALVARAERLGVEVPPGVFVPQPETLGALPPGFSFPVVLKARRSRFLVGGRWQAGSARVVRGAEELRDAALDPGLAGGALLQTFVPGHGEAVFALAREGEVLVRFAHRRLREKPPAGGESVLRESIAPDPLLAAASERLLGDLAFSGVAMVEFRRAPDGRAFLMEVNPRLWGSLQLAVDAGVDFPSLLVALTRGEPIPPVEARLGVRTRWLLGDLDHLWICLRRAEARRATGRGALRVLADFVAGFFDGSRSEIWRRDDPRPFLREVRGRI